MPIQKVERLKSLIGCCQKKAFAEEKVWKTSCLSTLCRLRLQTKEFMEKSVLSQTIPARQSICEPILFIFLFLKRLLGQLPTDLTISKTCFDYQHSPSTRKNCFYFVQETRGLRRA